MHGFKSIFLGLSLALIVLGLAYLGLGARGLAQHEPRAGVLVGAWRRRGARGSRAMDSGPADERRAVKAGGRTWRNWQTRRT